MTTATFGFKKNTSPTIIEKAEKLLLGLEEFNVGINRKILDLEKGYEFLHLSDQMGERQFRRMIKANFPYTYGDILAQLTVAELHSRLPEFHDKILLLGASACKELRKASVALASKVLKTTATTVAEIKKIIAREKKGVALAPERAQQLNVGTVVEITKKDPKVCGWLAEVTEAPDEFGRLTARLLKTCKTRQFFVDEVQLYDRQHDTDPEAIITESGWELLKMQYALNDNDFMAIQEITYTHAQQDASEETAEIRVLWKHAYAALDRHNLQPKFSAAAINSKLTSAPPEKTYTLADLEAAKEQAIAEYKVALELEWEERKRVLEAEWIERTRKLTEEIKRLEEAVQVRDEALKSAVEIGAAPAAREERHALDAQLDTQENLKGLAAENALLKVDCQMLEKDLQQDSEFCTLSGEVQEEFSVEFPTDASTIEVLEASVSQEDDAPSQCRQIVEAFNNGKAPIQEDEFVGSHFHANFVENGYFNGSVVASS